RNNPQWAANLQQVHADRVAGRVQAPPLTFQQQTVNNNLRVVTPVNQLANHNVQLQRVTANQLANHQATAQQLRNLAQTRQQQELAAAKAHKNGQQFTAQSLRLNAAPHVNAVQAAPKLNVQNNVI